MTTWKSLRRKTGFSKQYKFHVNLLTSAELICKTSKFNKIPLVLMTSVVKIFHLNKMISALNQCFQGDSYWKLSKHFSCKLFYLKQLILYFFHGNSWRLKWIKDTLIIQAKKSTPNIDLISWYCCIIATWSYKIYFKFGDNNCWSTYVWGCYFKRKM